MNKKNYHSTDYIEHLRYLLHFPIEPNLEAHHAGRVRALAWVVCGIDFTEDILQRKDEVELAIEAIEERFQPNLSFFDKIYVYIIGLPFVLMLALINLKSKQKRE